MLHSESKNETEYLNEHLGNNSTLLHSNVIDTGSVGMDGSSKYEYRSINS